MSQNLGLNPEDSVKQSTASGKVHRSGRIGGGMKTQNMVTTFCLMVAVLQTLGVTPSSSKPHVVFVTGDHEYSGEETMPLLARELEKNYGMKATVLKAYPDQDSE